MKQQNMENKNSEYGGSVLLIGELSPGAQLWAEMLSQRENICRYAIIESVSVIPSGIEYLKNPSHLSINDC